MDPSETALILVDVQNEYLKKDGILNKDVSQVLHEQNVLHNIVYTTIAARHRGVLIIHCPLDSIGEYKTLSGNEPVGVMKHIIDAHALKKDTWGVMIANVLQPQAQDYVMSGKKCLNAFQDTYLEKLLREQSIKHVVIAGFTAEGSVHSTVSAAYDKEFKATVLTDCIASDKKVYENELQTLPSFSALMSADKFMKQLYQGAYLRMLNDVGDEDEFKQDQATLQKQIDTLYERHCVLFPEIKSTRQQ